MVVSSFGHETNSVRSPPVLIGTPLTSSMATVLFSPSLLSCVMYCLLFCVVNSAEDGTKDEVLPDSQHSLFKETDAVTPRNTEKVWISPSVWCITMICDYFSGNDGSFFPQLCAKRRVLNYILQEQHCACKMYNNTLHYFCVWCV